MLADVEYLLAELAIAALGFGVAFHPAVRSMSLASRAAVSLAAGAVGLTLEATLFSTLGLRWSLTGLAAPILCLSLFLGWRWNRLRSIPQSSWRASPWVVVVASGAAVISVVFLIVSLLSSAATSSDFLLFWGVKAARYAFHRGIDVDFLRDPISFHAVPDYPPLIPIVQAWGCLAAQKMPWRLVPILSAVWLVAGIPIVFERSRRSLSDNAAAALTAFWTAATSVSLSYSASGGNAEAPLLFFETTAAIWLLTEREPGESRFVPIVALCGAALTKVEGSLAVACLALGMAVREQGLPGRFRRLLALAATPAAAVGIWFLYQWSHSLPFGYRAHGSLFDIKSEHLWPILTVMPRFLNAGSFWLPWIFPLLLVLAFPAKWKRAAPALTLTAGLLLFLVLDYLHDADIPRTRIEWTLPRVSQPALSALILAAGLISLGRRESASASPERPTAPRGGVR
jgi:hypothetical protein